MYGELTNQATISRLQEALQKQVEDQMEILLYKKNSNAITLKFTILESYSRPTAQQLNVQFYFVHVSVNSCRNAGILLT